MTEKNYAAASYNPIFELLVDDEDDAITGYVAYALYKQKKRDWVKAFKARHGRSPIDADLDWYTQAEILPRNITSLKREARAILDEYAASITEAQYADLKQRAANSAVLAEVRSALSRVESQSSLWNQIKITVASTFFALIILIVLSVAIALFGVDPLDGAQKLRQYLRD